MKIIRFADRQLGGYSRHTSIIDLYEGNLRGSCLCSDGDKYNILDKKDGKKKCDSCYKLNNLESITEENMIEELDDVYGFTIEKYEVKVGDTIVLRKDESVVAVTEIDGEYFKYQDCNDWCSAEDIMCVIAS